MARGTQHRKRRTGPNARVASPSVAQTTRKKKAPPSWEDQLFFNRLRRHAKWVFVLLAIFFAAGFVLFGVGSGSTGLNSVLQNMFQGSGSTGANISKLQKATVKNPKDSKAWRDYATGLEQKNKLPDAANALSRYIALKPKDASAVEELAGIYLRQATNYENDYAIAQGIYTFQAANPVFQPAASSSLGKAFAAQGGLLDPISSAAGGVLSTQSSTVFQNLATAEQNAVATYQKLAVLQPNDATTQFRLGQIASQAAQLTSASTNKQVAIKAIRAFLKLSPNDPLAPQAKTALKSLLKK